MFSIGFPCTVSKSVSITDSRARCCFVPNTGRSLIAAVSRANQQQRKKALVPFLVHRSSLNGEMLSHTCSNALWSRLNPGCSSASFPPKKTQIGLELIKMDLQTFRTELNNPFKMTLSYLLVLINNHDSILIKFSLKTIGMDRKTDKFQSNATNYHHQ